MSNKDDLFIFTSLQDDEPINPVEDTPDLVTDEPVADAVDGPPVIPEDNAPVVETQPIVDELDKVQATEEDQDEFAAPDAVQTVVEPSFSGTADALTAAKKVRNGKPTTEEDLDEMAIASAPASDRKAEETESEGESESAPQKRNPFMRFLGGIVPHIGDSAFDIVRKCIMLTGILVFIGAATYLIDDLILIPIHNDVLVESLQEMYTPGTEQTLNENEQNFKYPADMDPSFKKLYYMNSDIRGWFNYKTTDDGATFNIDYPVVQSSNNDHYLYRDFNRTYNKNGTLFYDYRNDFSSKKSKNRNTIIYGHNMASGQMFAGLNKLLWGVGQARLAPTFTMNTLYNKAEYKVFAVMLLNNNPDDGVPFGYLRTDFNDNIDFAGFLSEIMARSLYIYGDVDVRPDDEIVSLSTCATTDWAHFKDGRTVVVARKVRPGEKAATDVSKITANEDVIMPYAWYTNQKQTPHPFYTDPNYFIQPLDTLMAFLATSTVPSGQTTTSFTLFQQDGTFGIVPPTTMTDAHGNIVTQGYKPGLITVSVESTPIYYSLGSSFDYDSTKVVAIYSDGKKEDIDPRTCAIVGFDSSKVGEREISLHYGLIVVKFKVIVIDGVVIPNNGSTMAATNATTSTVSTTSAATTNATTTKITTSTTVITTTTTTSTTTTTTTTRPANFVPFDPNAKKTTTTTVATTTAAETTTVTQPTEAETTTTTETPAVISDVTDLD